MEDDDIDAREMQRRALEEAFGESSDSGGDNDDEFESSSSSRSSLLHCLVRLPHPLFLSSPFSSLFRRICRWSIASGSLLLQKQGDGVPLSWEMVDGVKGLWLCRGFLCSAQQSSLLSAIRRGSGHLKIDGLYFFSSFLVVFFCTSTSILLALLIRICRGVVRWRLSQSGKFTFDSLFDSCVLLISTWQEL